jgi:ABC-type transport system involved in multi-copper enzyme maturation permease subunit
MALRIGPGPVFAYEWLVATRRWQPYALRAGFVAFLLFGLIVTWWIVAAGVELATINAQAAVGRKYGYSLVAIQLALVLLAAPAATAGAISVDRARGNLALLLVTDLSNAEIILGKLFARMIPTVGLVACTVPILGLGTLMGGLDPNAMGLALLVTFDVAVFGCCLALALSVWSAKTHEVVMAVYLMIGGWLLFAPVWDGLARSGGRIGGAPSWVWLANPFWLAFSPSLESQRVSWLEFAGFTAATLGISLALLTLSVMRLRAAARYEPRQARAKRWSLIPASVFRRIRLALPGPSLDSNPVLWREWHRSVPSRWSRLVWGTFFLVTSWLCLWGVIDLWRNGASLGPNIGVLGLMITVLMGLLLLSAAAPTSLTEERVRGSLDVLMTTPLSTWSIVWGKWWGAFRVAPLLMVWPVVVTTALVFAERKVPAAWGIRPGPVGTTLRVTCVLIMAGIVLAHGALLTSLGLALATWVKRPGRAVALAVTLFIMMTIGWPILVMVLADGSRTDRRTAEGIACLSPVFATVSIAETVMLRVPADVIVIIGWILFWLLAAALGALGLLAAVMCTFDRCLGRMPEIVLRDLSPKLYEDLARLPGAVGVPASLAGTGSSSPSNL